MSLEAPQLPTAGARLAPNLNWRLHRSSRAEKQAPDACPCKSQGLTLERALARICTRSSQEPAPPPPACASTTLAGVSPESWCLGHLLPYRLPIVGPIAAKAKLHQELPSFNHHFLIHHHIIQSLLSIFTHRHHLLSSWAWISLPSPYRPLSALSRTRPPPSKYLAHAPRL